MLTISGCILNFGKCNKFVFSNLLSANTIAKVVMLITTRANRVSSSPYK